MEADVIVIGGGMAGAVAALKAASAGCDVLLIRRGHGSTAMSSGTVDVAGPDGFLPHDPWDALPSIKQRLKEILRANPLHPYSIIAGGREESDRLSSLLRDACDFAIEKIPSLRYRGSHERNMALPTAVGTVKFCAFAPASLAGGDLTRMQGANLALVGLEGLPHFRPRLCKRALSGYSSLHQPESISKIESVEIAIPRSKNMIRSTPFEVAALFDDPGACDEFAESLGKLIGSDVTHVGMPPTLGLNNHAEAFERIGRGLEQELFEMISPGYSVPGHRLQMALNEALVSNGVRTVTAGVGKAECDGRLIRNLVLEETRSSRTASAKKYIVATGKFSSGGLVSDDYPREALFGLPLFACGERVDDKYLQYQLDPNIRKKQNFLSCGIRVDATLHPLDAFGEPVYDNLFAAGSIIGEYDYVAEKCGFGTAILTGHVAGANAAA